MSISLSTPALFTCGISGLNSLIATSGNYASQDLFPAEILKEGVIKEWSQQQNCYIYRVNKPEKKYVERRKENVDSLIAHYYKLK